MRGRVIGRLRQDRPSFFVVRLSERSSPAGRCAGWTDHKERWWVPLLHPQNRDVRFISGGDHVFFVQEQCSAGFYGKYGGAGFAHGWDSTEAGYGDVEQQVFAAASHFYETQPAAAH